jgi:hypothetical protein
LTFPPGFRPLVGAIETFTGVFDLSEGLEADEGVFGRASWEIVRAGGTMVYSLFKSSMHSSMTVRYLVRRETYMKRR